jgi:hypothetical protein
MNGGDIVMIGGTGGTGGTSGSGGCITITGGDSYGASDVDYSNCVGTYLGEDLKDPNSLRNSWDDLASALRSVPTARNYIESDVETLKVDAGGVLEFNDSSDMYVTKAYIDSQMGGSDLDEIQDQLAEQGDQLVALDDAFELLDTKVRDLELQEFEDGWTSNPSIAFKNEYGLGMFRKGYGEIGFSVNGQEVGSINKDGIHFNNIDVLETRITLLENAIIEMRAMV